MFNSLKKTISHGIIYGLGQSLASAAGFLLIPVYTNHLTTEEYGVVSILGITASVLTSIFMLGLNSALFRSYYDYDDVNQRRVVISTTLLLLFCGMGAMLVIGYIGINQLNDLIFGTSGYEKYLIFIFWTAGFQMLQTIPFAVYRAKQQSIQYSVFNLFFLITRIAIIIYLIVWHQEGVWGFVLGNFLITMISTLVLLWTIHEQIRPVFSLFEARRLLSFGLPLVIVNLAGLILNMSDRYFLRFFSGLEVVGIYNLGYQFGMLIVILLVQPLKLIWPPMLFSVEKKDYALHYYSKVLTYFVFLGLFATLGISLLSNDVLKWFAQPAYWSSSSVVIYICLAYVLFGAQEIMNPGIALKRRTEYNALIFFLGAIVNLLLNLLLIPKVGMMGAAYATIISFLVICILKYFIGRRLLLINYEWIRILKLVFVAAFIYTIGMVIHIDSIFGSILIHLFLALLFIPIMYLMKFYNEDELKFLRKFIIGLPSSLKEKQFFF